MVYFMIVMEWFREPEIFKQSENQLVRFKLLSEQSISCLAWG